MTNQAADQSENEPLRGVTIPCDATVTHVTVVREGQNRSCMLKFRLGLIIINLILIFVLYKICWKKTVEQEKLTMDEKPQ